MNYLDAAIGFAVVMAVFSGAATTANQFFKQLIKSKARNTLRVIYRLQQRLQEYDEVQLNAEQRYKILTSIINNPLTPGKGITPKEEPDTTQEPERKEIDARYEMLLKTIGECRIPPDGTYAKVSTEHVCRRTAEVLVDAGVNLSNLESVLNKISREFDYYSSSISTRFQRNAKLVSLVFGVLIAFAFNINAYRILDYFIENPVASRSFAEQVETLEHKVKDTIEKGQESGDEITNNQIYEQLEDIEATALSLSNQGIPIGNYYPPHCLKIANISCVDKTKSYGKLDWIRDFLVLLLTGLLIGLGSPFWFDVAKRLAGVRRWFGGPGNSAEAKSGKDTTSSATERKSLVSEIVNDEQSEGSIKPMFKTFRKVEQGSTLTIQVSNTSNHIRYTAELEDDTGDQTVWKSAAMKAPGGISTPLTGADRYSLLIDFIFDEADTAAVKMTIDSPSGTQSHVHGFNVSGAADKAYSAQLNIRMQG